METQARSIRNILLILLIIAVFAVLRQLAGLIIPLVLAALLTILALPLVNFLEKRRFPHFLITLLVAGLSLAALWLVVSMISGAIEQIVQDREFLAQQFNRKINIAVNWLGNTLPGVDVSFLKEELNTLIAPTSIANLIGSALGTLGSLGSSSLLFFIYYLILLSGATRYRAWLEYVMEKEHDSSSRGVWDLTQKSISAYMGIKTVISAVTGLLTGLICWAFGLQFAMFWGFLAFLLNYIPSIGSLAATILPVFMAIIQFDSFGIIMMLSILIGLCQVIIGSVIDPIIMGNRLRLNTVTVIFGLLFWGYIWGIPGMLLSVPLMVSVRLLLERSDDLSIIARVMGHPVKAGRKRTPLLARILKD